MTGPYHNIPVYHDPNGTMRKPTNLAEYMRATVGRNWVIARRTPRIVAKYGEDVVCLSPAKYKALETQWEAIKPDPKRDAIAYARIAMTIARRRIEALPAGYAPGQRSGPNERDAHAALDVALRLGEEAGLWS